MKNAHYWQYNLPLQVWPVHEDPDDEGSPVIDARVLNYMPRKERCTDIELSELIGEQTKEEFFETAAQMLLNLAKLMREYGKGERSYIYYHDEGFEESK